MPNASAAPVSSLWRERRLKESATRRMNILANSTQLSSVRNFVRSLGQRGNIEDKIGAIDARRHANRVAAAGFTDGRDVNRRAAVPANNVLAVLTIAFS